MLCQPLYSQDEGRLTQDHSTLTHQSQPPFRKVGVDRIGWRANDVGQHRSASWRKLAGYTVASRTHLLSTCPGFLWTHLRHEVSTPCGSGWALTRFLRELNNKRAHPLPQVVLTHAYQSEISALTVGERCFVYWPTALLSRTNPSRSHES